MVSQPNDSGIDRRDERDRRRVSLYRFLDKRSGFDRRRRYPILGSMRDHPWLLALVLVLVNILSWLDGVLTLYEVRTGIASEGNPVLANLFDRHPALAIMVKTGAILLVSAGVWHARHYRIMHALAVCAMAVFTALLAYHLGSLYGLGLL